MTQRKDRTLTVEELIELLQRQIEALSATCKMLETRIASLEAQIAANKTVDCIGKQVTFPTRIGSVGYCLPTASTNSSTVSAASARIL